MPHPTPMPPAQTPESARVIQGPLKRRLAFLSVTHPLDFAGAIHLLDQARVLSGAPCCLMVDLERCEGIDLSAFRALLRLYDALDTAGGELRLIVPPYNRINAALAFFGLRSRLNVYATLREACTEVTLDSPQERPCTPDAALSSLSEGNGRTLLEAC